ncbi:MAG: hypothetical protein RRA45_03965 [Saccharolobus sp.]|jgi:hypothetical protein|uniref:hypothetical protein n=1 Tax=Saccharolobus sp. TaxID=2100761 RepID=UPI0028CC3946|nr:hypothetical protein [Saccharolobus sp.]MDT7861352.1 hypothetical protein [Saccharolobus sp.]
MIEFNLNVNHKQFSMPYQCPSCDYVGDSITSLKKHFRKRHSNNCDKCGFKGQNVIHHYMRLALEGYEDHLIFWFLSNGFRESENRLELKEKVIKLVKQKLFINAQHRNKLRVKKSKII